MTLTRNQKRLLERAIELYLAESTDLSSLAVLATYTAEELKDALSPFLTRIQTDLRVEQASLPRRDADLTRDINDITTIQTQLTTTLSPARNL